MFLQSCKDLMTKFSAYNFVTNRSESCKISTDKQTQEIKSLCLSANGQMSAAASETYMCLSLRVISGSTFYSGQMVTCVLT